MPSGRGLSDGDAQFRFRVAYFVGPGHHPDVQNKGLLPQTVLLKIMNRIVMSKLGPFIDAASERYGFSNVVLGGVRGSQPQDISFTVSQVLETGRDRSKVAQADVEKLHDYVPWGVTLKGLLSRQVPPAWAHAALRLHRLPNVVLRVVASTTQSLERTRGVLTGAASSGMLSRICLEDSLLAALPELETQGFQIDSSRQLSVMSWSDNLFTFSSSAAQACQMMLTWSHYFVA